jgi:hypothetical protein
MPQQNHLISYILTGTMLALVFGLRIWRMRRATRVPRRLRLEYLWIMPAIMALASAALLVGMPPQGIDWLWLALATAAGGALGWVRGSLIHIEVDRATHLLNTRTSPAAIIFLLILFAVRFGARMLLAQAGPMVHAHLALVTDGFVLLAAGLFAVSRLEMWLRARRLLREAKAAGTTGVISDGRPEAVGASPPWG